MKQHAPLILASGSAIRQQMLKAVGLTFSVVPSGVDEEAVKHAHTGLPIAQLALTLATAKAMAVSRQNPDAFIIGADQLCALGDHIFDKPGSHKNAEAQLAQLAGKTHTQHCGVALVHGSDSVWEHHAVAALSMRPLTAEQIHAYVAADAPLASCGAYLFESLGRHLFTQVSGDHDVIQGLPLVALLTALHAKSIIGL